MWCYARVLAHYPYVVLTAVLLVSVTCLIVTVTIGNRPNFEEPMAGFEPRGTEISNRLTAYSNLVDDPNVSPQPQKAVIQTANNQLTYMDLRLPPGNRSSPATYQHRRSKRRKWRKPFFCDVPDGQWIKLVYHSHRKTDLFTLQNIQNMCALEERYITSNPIYTRNCLREADNTNCCRTLSLGNYITLLTDKPSCSNLTEDDVRSVKNLIEMCVGFYKNFSLTESCDWRHSPLGDSFHRKCKEIPKSCQKYNAVYNIMHFISDHSFQRQDQKLRYSVSFLPISFQSLTNRKVDEAISLYLDLEANVEPVGDIEIAGADFGIKDHLFHHYLTKDSKWIVIGGVIIFFVVWTFTGSIFVTVMTFMSMFWSLELAYFLYVFVFEITFFPYMNLVTVLLVIAIGADDVFVYSKIWHLAKRERNNGTLEKLVSDTLKNATMSMFVTSLTTAGALFANVVSPITSIKCFSIYAGTAILCNLVLMVTWTPAAIVAEEKWCNFCFINSPKIYKKIHEYYRLFFELLLPKFVLRLRFIWILLLGAIGILSGIAVFHHPKLRLPTSFHFQMFRNDHLMEMYDQHLRENFWFEKAVGERRPLMPITIVWGIEKSDNGDRLNPYDKGFVTFEDSFNPSSPRSQIWLRQFCFKLRESGFYQRVTPFEIPNCYIEHFTLFMRQPCTVEEPVCCQRTNFPFPEKIFSHCIEKYIPLAMKDYTFFWTKYTPGLKFVGNKVKALVVQFSSNLTYTYDYKTMETFYVRMNKWVHEQMEGAPEGLDKGWFISEFQFYSIQKSLAEGLPVAFGISILVATLVTFFTSLNVLLTLYAMVTITFIMMTTTACLVLLDWELNVLESVIITVSVGLSIDFTLHYGVAYRLAPDLDRKNRAYCSLVRVGSVICMAALTTFLAGLCMVPSVTLVYQKFGIFLMLVISISWVYSTFFFQSLLNVIGPQSGFGQFHWPSLDCCSMSSQSHVDRTVYTMSESTMSTSSSGYHYHPSIDTNATEHDYLSERSDSHPNTPHHYRTRPGRNYARPKSESLSPDNQFERKLLNGDDKNSSGDRTSGNSTLERAGKTICGVVMDIQDEENDEAEKQSTAV
ncbi:protein dispatched homolog 1-like isoform X1 [Mya arenaria]|uniref:protein dispatched homolog 1-like isoform X1 n=1 Tax=Mya arenaria TaxID=6604 RepID=UPI0022E85C60|nr:protein dispatched homolog 1-like isoform X1 [Mya arenaria]XP_052768968.1 protein dispatched homolog 1-like isoform X1 [Mya arenaria]XP_052768969.1 protein dispatched homolog 1-like isoform X1 [Mya arenaria]XP_052768970.1 protein dispatched homolog 1-like isoform X1 [Mya arenaria]